MYYFGQELVLFADKMKKYKNFKIQFFRLNIHFFNRSLSSFNKGVKCLFFRTFNNFVHSLQDPESTKRFQSIVT